MIKSPTYGSKVTCPMDSGAHFIPQLAAIMSSQSLYFGNWLTGMQRASSDLPANVFYQANQKQGIFDEFCEQIDEKKLDDSSPHKWTVSAKGEKQSGQSRRKRTPPPNPNAYKQMVNFDWTPNKNERNCRVSCQWAYQAMAQSGCGTVGRLFEKYTGTASQN